MKDLIAALLDVCQRKEYTIFGAPKQWRRITKAHSGSSRLSSFSKSTINVPVFSLSFVQKNVGAPNANLRTSIPKTSFQFIFISSLPKNTVDHSLHILILMWRPRSEPSSQMMFQDIMRSSSRSARTPLSRYHECF